MKLQNANREMSAEDREKVYSLSGATVTVKACNLVGQRTCPKVGRTVVTPVSLSSGGFLHIPTRVIEEIPGDFSWTYNGSLCKDQQWRWVVQFPDTKALLDTAQSVGEREARRAEERRRRNAKKHQLMGVAEYGFRSSNWAQPLALGELDKKQLEGLLLSVSEYLNKKVITDPDWAKSLRESSKAELTHLVGEISKLLSEPANTANA
jgi:hypothetical protein